MVRNSGFLGIILGIILITTLVAAAPSSLPLPQQAKGDSSFFLNTNEAIQWEKGTDTFILQLQMIEPERALLNLVINGESRRFFVKKGTPLNLDVTGDKQPDGSVSLISVMENKGEFKMTSVTDTPAQNAPISQSTTPVSTSGQPEEKSSQNYLYYIIGALAVLIIILLVWIARRKRF